MRNQTLFLAVIALICCAPLAHAQNAGVGVMSPLEKLHVSEGSLLLSGVPTSRAGIELLPLGSAGNAGGRISDFHTTGDVNIFLGYKAGYYETGSDKLYIDNSDAPVPLIYGNFTQDNVTIYGSLRVTDLANDNAQDSVLVVNGNGTFGYRDAATLGGGGHWSLIGNDIENTNNGIVKVTGGLSLSNAVTSYMDFYTGNNTGHLTAGLIGQTGDAIFWNRLNRRLQFGTNDLPRVTILANGDVGIGTQSPAGRLSLAKQGSRTISLMFRCDDGIENNEEYSTARIQAGWEAGQVAWNQGFLKFDNTTAEGVYSTTMTLKGGNVGIGTTTPQSKLAVNGTITCKEVEVTLAGFPDYVFEDHYELMPLKAVEAFINTYGHLPNVPSAQEVEENGIGLGELNKILLEKVEELTLHLIAQQKQIQEQEAMLKLLVNNTQKQ